MKERKITDLIKAQAAIAHLISQGWQIDLAGINKTIPGGLNDNDWIEMANGCLNGLLNEMAKDKVIPINRFIRGEA